MDIIGRSCMLITSYNCDYQQDFMPPYVLREVMPAASQSEAMQSKILHFANLLANKHNKSMQLLRELLNKIQTFGKPLTFVGPNRSHRITGNF